MFDVILYIPFWLVFDYRRIKFVEGINERMIKSMHKIKYH